VKDLSPSLKIPSFLIHSFLYPKITSILSRGRVTANTKGGHKEEEEEEDRKEEKEELGVDEDGNIYPFININSLSLLGIYGYIN